MELRNTQSGTQIRGRIETRTHDVETLEDEVDGWNELTKKEKYLIVTPSERLDFSKLDESEEEYARIDVEAAYENVDYNTTCVGMHEYFVRNLDPGATDNEEVTHLALGIDGTTPSVENETLGQEIYRTEITDHAPNGNELLCSTFISSSEANDSDLAELGLWTGPESETDAILLNHSTFSTVTKDNTKTVTFDVTLIFDAQ